MRLFAKIGSLCIFGLALINLQAATYSSVTSGDWSESATWSGGSVPPTTFSNNDNVIINNGDEVVLNSTLTFNNNCALYVYGSLVVNADVVVNNNLDLVVTGSLVIEGNFSAHNNAVVNIEGDVLITGSCDVNNNAAMDVDGSFSVYGDFTGGNNNTLTGDGEVNVQGSMSGLDTSGYSGSVTSGYTPYMGLTNYGCVIKVGSNDIIYIDGDGNADFNNVFEGGNNGQIDLDGKIILEGDWNNLSSDSVFLNIDDDGTVVFAGTTEQSLGGSKATYFEKVEIDNTSNVAIDDNIIINKMLTFTNGAITTTATDTVIILNTETTAISSADVGKAVVGNLRRYLQTGSYDFPISHSGNYLPAVVNITTQGSMNYISAKFIASSSETVPAGLEVGGTPITTFLDYGYWVFTPDDGTGVVYDITLTSRGHSNGGAEASQHAIFKRDAGDWESTGDHDNGTQSGTGTDPVTAHRSNVTGFSDFIIGKSDDNPLSVELLSFNATCSENGILLEWQTASESNNAFFTLQHGINGMDFEDIETQTGAGYSNQIIHYEYLHSEAKQGINYYRLVQTDYNGIPASSEVISALCQFPAIREVQLFMDGEDMMVAFNSTYNQDLEIRLYDPLARMVSHENYSAINGFNSIRLDLNSKQKGIYLIHIFNAFDNSTITFYRK